MTAFILALAAFFAGLLKVGFGQGSGFLALPLCTLVVSARFANGILAPLLSLGDMVSVPAYWRQWETRLLLLFVPGQAAGVALGAWALARLSEAAARRSIGGLLVAAVLSQVWIRRRAAASSWHPQRPPFPPAAVLVSFITGFTSALAQLGSGFLSVYLVRLRTAQRAIVPTLNITFLFSNLVKVAMYWRYGLITRATLIADAWLAPLLLLGGLAGVAANRQLSQRAFENALLGFGLVAGAKLMLW